MKVQFRLTVFVCLIFSLFSLPSLAGPPNFVSEEARTVAGGRAVQVLVAQSEIKSNINQSYATVALGGGLLGALIDAAVEAERAKKAEEDITPIREALTGFDVDALAQTTAKASLEGVPWLQAAPVSFGKDSTALGKSAALDAGSTEQIAFLEYTYDVSSEFDAVRVVLNMQFAKRALPPSKAKKEPKPESRLSSKNLTYSQTITSVVMLPDRSVHNTENATRLATDGGKLTRDALITAFRDVQQLTIRALTLTEAEIEAMESREHKRTTIAGFSGRKQNAEGADTLLWNDAFVHAQPMSAPAAGEPAVAEQGPAGDVAPGDAGAQAGTASDQATAAPDQAAAPADEAAPATEAAAPSDTAAQPAEPVDTAAAPAADPEAGLAQAPGEAAAPQPDAVPDPAAMPQPAPEQPAPPQVALEPATPGQAASAPVAPAPDQGAPVSQ